MKYYFKQWQDGDVNLSKTITLASDMTLTAYYAIGYNLSIVRGTGGTTNPPSGNYTVAEGTQIVVTALPDTGYRFVKWLLDGVVRTENPITITMGADHTLEAIFEYVSPPPLTATVSGIVKDSAGNPIPAATVTCDGYADVTETDGAYIFSNIPAQPYTLTITKQGYQTQAIPVDLSAGGTVTQDVILSPAPAPTIPSWAWTIPLGFIFVGVIYFGTKKKG